MNDRHPYFQITCFQIAGPPMAFKVTRKLLSLVCFMFGQILNFFPLAMATLVFINPCQPPLLGYLINFAKSNNLCVPGSYGITSRFLLAAWEALFILYTYINIFQYGVVNFMTGLLFLWEASRRVLLTRKFSTEYRMLQVFESLLNSTVRYRVWPALTAYLPALHVLGAVACIKFHKHLALPNFVFVISVSIIVAVTELIFYTGCSKIYGNSLSWLSCVKSGGMKMNKVERKMVRSMQPLRIWFGSNFVDELTPLVIQNFCTDQTVSVLLLF